MYAIVKVVLICAMRTNDDVNERMREIIMRVLFRNVSESFVLSVINNIWRWKEFPKLCNTGTGDKLMLSFYKSFLERILSKKELETM